MIYKILCLIKNKPFKFLTHDKEKHEKNLRMFDDHHKEVEIIFAGITQEPQDAQEYYLNGGLV